MIPILLGLKSQYRITWECRQNAIYGSKGDYVTDDVITPTCLKWHFMGGAHIPSVTCL